MGLVEGEILVFVKDDNATLGVVWAVLSVTFDYQAGHGWDGAG